MGDDYIRISENLLLFEDGLLGFDFNYFEFLANGMFNFLGRYQYHNQVKLLLNIFEAVMEIVRTERIDEAWLHKAQLRHATCKRVLQDFPDNGDFTQWRKLAFNELRIGKLMLALLHGHEDLALRPTVLESHRAWRAWRAAHPSIYNRDHQN